MTKNQILTLRLPAPDGVTAGNQSIISLPIGRRFHGVRLVGGADNKNIVTLCDEIRVKAGNDVIHRYSGAQRNTMNQFDGMAGAAAAGKSLFIPFNRQLLKTRQMEEDTSIQTGTADEQGRKITALTIEVDIAADATNPTLRGYSLTSDNVGAGPGSILHVKNETVQVTSVGEREIILDQIGTGRKLLLNRAHLFSGDIDRLQVKRDSADLSDRTKQLNTDIQLDGGVRTPQANHWAYDPSEQGYGLEAVDLVGVQDFRLVAQLTATTDIPMIAEYIGTLS